ESEQIVQLLVLKSRKIENSCFLLKVYAIHAEQEEIRYELDIKQYPKASLPQAFLVILQHKTVAPIAINTRTTTVSTKLREPPLHAPANFQVHTIPVSHSSLRFTLICHRISFSAYRLHLCQHCQASSI